MKRDTGLPLRIRTHPRCSMPYKRGSRAPVELEPLIVDNPKEGVLRSPSLRYDITRDSSDRARANF